MHNKCTCFGRNSPQIHQTYLERLIEYGKNENLWMQTVLVYNEDPMNTIKIRITLDTGIKFTSDIRIIDPKDIRILTFPRAGEPKLEIALGQTVQREPLNQEKLNCIFVDSNGTPRSVDCERLPEGLRKRIG